MDWSIATLPLYIKNSTIGASSSFLFHVNLVPVTRLVTDIFVLIHI